MAVDGTKDGDERSDEGKPSTGRVERDAEGVLCAASARTAYRAVEAAAPATVDSLTRVNGPTEGSAAVARVKTEGTTITHRAQGMEVVGRDGLHIGVVDHVDGATLRLRPSDEASRGVTRLVPMAWVQTVDQQIRLRLSASEAEATWGKG